MGSLNVFLQAKQLTCPSNFTRTFTFIGHWHNSGARGGGLYHYGQGWTPTVLRPIGINVRLIKFIIRIAFIRSSSHLGHRCCVTFSCNYCVSSITHVGVAHKGGLILFQPNSTTLSLTSSPFFLPFSYRGISPNNGCLASLPTSSHTNYVNHTWIAFTWNHRGSDISKNVSGSNLWMTPSCDYRRTG